MRKLSLIAAAKGSTNAFCRMLFPIGADRKWGRCKNMQTDANCRQNFIENRLSTRSSKCLNQNLSGNMRAQRVSVLTIGIP